MPKPKAEYGGLKPPLMKIAVWNRIIEAWRNGMSDREAAFYASEISSVHIKESDLKEMMEENPEIEDLRNNLQDSLMSKAKLNVAEAIDGKNMAMTRWLLERKRADEYSTKSAVAFEGAVVELTIEEKKKKLDEMMKDFGNE